MFGSRVHPVCFQAVFLLEDCVGNDELMLCTEFEQEAPIVITVPNALSSKDSFPGLGVPPNSSVKVANNEDLVTCRGVIQESEQIGIEAIFVRGICVRCCLPSRGRRVDMMRSERPMGSLSSLETKEFLTMIPTTDRRLSVDGFPDQKRV